ncbi:MAG TPA: methyltransferase [Thermoplasmata archaeon]|nr:methyltransferase [Thermoplasmata archaeon]
MPDDDAPAAEQYFVEQPHARSVRTQRRFLYQGELLSFMVDSGIFASHGLDPGTALLIENLAPRRTDRILDLGCGWGAIGVAAAKSAPGGRVVLTDVNRRAARLARENLARNRIPNAEVRVGSLFEPVAGEAFDLIATNPPFHAGRPLILQLLSEAPQHLAPDGRIVLVGKGSQGIRFYQEWLEAHWPGPVTVLGRGSGYRVLEARREGTGLVR